MWVYAHTHTLTSPQRAPSCLEMMVAARGVLYISASSPKLPLLLYWPTQQPTPSFCTTISYTPLQQKQNVTEHWHNTFFFSSRFMLMVFCCSHLNQRFNMVWGSGPDVQQVREMLLYCSRAAGIRLRGETKPTPTQRQLASVSKC